VEFVTGDFGDGAGEADRARGLLELAAQLASQAVELCGGEVFHFPAGELGFDLLELVTQPVDAVGDRREPFSGEGFEFDRPQVLDLELELAAPVNEGGLGDIQLGHKPGIGPALGPEFDELLNRFLIFHVTFRSPRTVTNATIRADCCRLRAPKRSQTDVVKPITLSKDSGPWTHSFKDSVNLGIQWIQWFDGWIDLKDEWMMDGEWWMNGMMEG
jgi:hypothetical protein